MTDRLARINLHPGTPTIITGDWNLHHNNWNSMVEIESTPARTQEVVDWLKGQSFSLCSERNVHTRSGTGSQQDLVIDLTFANEIATGQGIVRNHTVNMDLATLSDHHTLTFTLGNPRESVHNITEAKYNWKEAEEGSFVEAFEQELHADTEIYDITIQQVLNKNRSQASPEELNNAVRLINECMERAAEKTVPIRQMCSRSKPWWNSDLTNAFKEMRDTRIMAKSYFQYFNWQSEIMLTEVKQLRKKALALVKSAKCEYYTNSQKKWICTTCGISGSGQMENMYIHRQLYPGEMEKYRQSHTAISAPCLDPLSSLPNPSYLMYHP